jgi:hypothetical protein
MDTDQPPRRGRPVAIIAAAGLVCLAIAVPVSGAFGAGSSGSDGNSNGAAPTQTQTPYGQNQYGQGQPGPGQPGRPDRDGDGGRGHLCPKHQGSGAPGQSQGSDSSGTVAPGNSVAL